MSCYLTLLQRLALTVWVGSMWTSGFIFAPILFSNLERKVAGDIAGQIFQITSYIGITCLLILITTIIFQNKKTFLKIWQYWVLIAALVITLFGEFYLAEAMRDLKVLHPELIKASPAYPEFARLHSYSSVLFLINSLLGLALLFKYQLVPKDE